MGYVPTRGERVIPNRVELVKAHAAEVILAGCATPRRVAGFPGLGLGL